MFRVALFFLSCFIPLLLMKLVLFLTRQNIIEINRDIWCKKRSFKLDVSKTRKTTTTKRDLCENLKKFCCRFVVVGWRTLFHNFHGVLNKKDENILEFSVYLAPRYGRFSRTMTNEQTFYVEINVSTELYLRKLLSMNRWTHCLH